MVGAVKRITNWLKLSKKNPFFNLQVNGTAITREKPSVVKKLMKPHKNILRLTIERPSKQERTYMGQTPLMKSEVGVVSFGNEKYWSAWYLDACLFHCTVLYFIVTMLEPTISSSWVSPL